jgi:hypothetical protein
MADVVAFNTAATAADVAVCGAAFSGLATCQPHENGGVYALTVSMPWRAWLDKLVAFAVEHDAVVTDEQTATAATLHVETRAVALLRATPSLLLEVHELVRQLHSDDDDDGDWMFGPGDKPPPPSGSPAVMAALRLAVGGSCDDALAALDAITDEATDSAPLVRRLRRRIDGDGGSEPT